MRIVPLDARIGTGPFGAALATSFHAMDWLNDAEAARLRGLRFFCVGARAATLARQKGLLDVHSPALDAGALLAELRLLPRDGNLLYLAGRDRKPALEAELARAGFTVETAVVYEAVAETSLPNATLEALRAGSLDAALHFSRRSAELLIDLVGKEGLAEKLAKIAHVCISADAAAPFVAMGATVKIAAMPGSNGLLAALESL